MLRLCFLVLVSLGLSVCQQPPGDLNDKWRNNDIVLQRIDNLFFDLAITTEEAFNQIRRFTSIVSLALSIYTSSDITDVDKRISDAENKTRRELSEPADAIAGLTRARIVYLRNAIDPPINDIKRSCRPETKQSDCDLNLNKIRAKNEKKCPGYKKQTNIYERLMNKNYSSLIVNFLNDLREASYTGGDEEALQFFLGASRDKYPKLFKFLRSIYKDLTAEPFSCNQLNLM